MSKRSELKARIHTLGEIRSILNAMKNLAVIETNKVSRFLGAEIEFGATIRETLNDFRRYFREAELELGLERLKTAGITYILVGSERGFCGGFNETLVKRLNEVASEERRPVRLISVGRKLGTLIANDARLLEVMPGATASEEIGDIIPSLIERLSGLPTFEWALIYYDGDIGQSPTVIHPFKLTPPTETSTSQLAPLLNLPPADLRPDLIEQYVFSLLYQAFYLSFLAENRARLRHMDGALNTLEKNWNGLKRMSNTLRQEEITQELEIIMLSAQAEQKPPRWRSKT
jgi:F-type H+-transporting ATPase subunit gamma